tara:strand:+ start:932 stop:1225 length:294 start_codon:yes stop_codon:yes gene_type:complete
MDVILDKFQENFGNKGVIKPETIENIENFRTKLIGVRNKLQETKDVLEERTKNMPGIKRRRRIETAKKVCIPTFLVLLALYVFFVRKQTLKITLVKR